MDEKIITGGNQWSLEADEMFGVDRYVHLCFRKNQATEYYARKEGRIDKTLWLAVDPSALKIEGVMFSYGVANASGAKICPILEAANDIDYEILTAPIDWNDEEMKARLRSVELCEVLVPDFLPLKYFERFLPNG